MVRSRTSANPGPITAPAARVAFKRKAPSPDSEDDHDELASSSSTSSAVEAPKVTPVNGYPFELRFIEEMDRHLQAKDAKKVLTRAQIANVVHLIRHPDELRSHPNATYRKWIMNHIVLNSSEYGVGVAYRNRGLLVAREDLYGVLLEAHRSKADGHAGRDKTTQAIQQNKRWVLKALVELFITLCPHCNDRNQTAKRNRAAHIDDSTTASAGLSVPGGAELPSVLRPSPPSPRTVYSVQTSSGQGSASGSSVSSTFNSPCSHIGHAHLYPSLHSVPAGARAAGFHLRQSSISSSAYSTDSYLSTNVSGSPASYPVPPSPPREPVFCMPPAEVQPQAPVGLGIPMPSCSALGGAGELGPPFVFGRDSQHGFFSGQAPSANATLALGFRPPSSDDSPANAFSQLLALERQRSDSAIGLGDDFYRLQQSHGHTSYASVSQNPMQSGFMQAPLLDPSSTSGNTGLPSSAFPEAPATPPPQYTGLPIPFWETPAPTNQGPQHCERSFAHERHSIGNITVELGAPQVPNWTPPFQDALALGPVEFDGYWSWPSDYELTRSFGLAV